MREGLLLLRQPGSPGGVGGGGRRGEEGGNERDGFMEE